MTMRQAKLFPFRRSFSTCHFPDKALLRSEGLRERCALIMRAQPRAEKKAQPQWRYCPPFLNPWNLIGAALLGLEWLITLHADNDLY